MRDAAHEPDYGEGKTADDDAIDSAMMLGVVSLLLIALLLGLGLGIALTLIWVT